MRVSSARSFSIKPEHVLAIALRTHRRLTSILDSMAGKSYSSTFGFAAR